MRSISIRRRLPSKHKYASMLHQTFTAQITTTMAYPSEWVYPLEYPPEQTYRLVPLSKYWLVCLLGWEYPSECPLGWEYPSEWLSAYRLAYP